MAIRNIKEMSQLRKLEIDLNGPDGNAYNLIGLAILFSRDLGFSPEPIIHKMMSGDYEHLIQVFDEYFGDHVDLFR